MKTWMSMNPIWTAAIAFASGIVTTLTFEAVAAKFGSDEKKETKEPKEKKAKEEKTEKAA